MKNEHGVVSVDESGLVNVCQPLVSDCQMVVKSKSDGCQEVISHLSEPCQALVKWKSPQDIEAERFGKNPDLISEILTDYETAGVADESNLCLLSYIAATSRLMDEPLNILIQATSGTGKSFIQKNTMQFIPPEDVVNASSLTECAISNMKQTALKHKILCIGEAEGVKHLYPLRVLIDGDSYDTHKTVGGETETKKVEGPVSVHVTNASWPIDDQTESRFFILETHQSEAHNCNVQKAQCLVGSLEGWKLKQKTNKKIAVHHAFQRSLSLEKYHVHNDISKAEYFGNKSEASLRQHQHFLDLCRAVCFLHQHQRTIHTINGEKHIFVDYQDIRIAKDLVSEIYGFSLDCLKPKEMELLVKLDEKIPKELRSNFTFTFEDVQKWTKNSKYSYGSIHAYMKALLSKGLVVKTGKIKGIDQYRLYWNGLKEGKVSLAFQYDVPEPVLFDVPRLCDQEKIDILNAENKRLEKKVKLLLDSEPPASVPPSVPVAESEPESEVKCKGYKALCHEIRFEFPDLRIEGKAVNYGNLLKFLQKKGWLGERQKRETELTGNRDLLYFEDVYRYNPEGLIHKGYPTLVVTVKGYNTIISLLGGVPVQPVVMDEETDDDVPF